MASPQFSVPVLFKEANHDYRPLWVESGETKIQVLPKGWTRDSGRRPLPVEMIWEKDVRITMRDGVKLLADVFRPANSSEQPVPAIMPWSPFGRSGAGRCVGNRQADRLR
jgi:uncharacterized protein